MPAGQRSSNGRAARRCRTCTTRPGVSRAQLDCRWVFPVGDRHVVGPLEAEEVALGREISLVRPVPLQVVRRDQRHDRHMRRPPHRLEVIEHVAGQFQHDQVGRVDLLQLRQQRPADVPADPRGEPPAEDLAEHGGGGGLALGPRDADQRGRAPLDEEPDLGRHRHAGRLGRQQVWVGRGDRRGCDDQVRRREIGVPVSAEAVLDRQPVELRQRIPELLGGRRSVTSTEAPSATSHRAAATFPPKCPSPATTTRLLRTACIRPVMLTQYRRAGTVTRVIPPPIASSPLPS